MDFFEISSKTVASLTRNERILFDYVVKNMNLIKNQSIREVSAECFVSTTTFLRFVRKLGFTGYSEFTTVLKFTLLGHTELKPSPFVVEQSDYREEYLKNIIESVRVLEPSKIKKITKKLVSKPRIYFFAKGLSKHAAKYIKYLYTMSGFLVEFPEDYQYRQAVLPHIGKNDLVFILTYGGHDIELIQTAQKLKSRNETPMLISITGADNNIIQNMSDINLYIFTDEIEMNNLDITSRISTIAIMELILYQFMEDETSSF
ncbi:MurR/RpiR family transcriptional regulator [Listeria monocytogenes]|nr:MurR/RpiR family transcriptional regulator [Listeria monocytogenes]EAF6795669.1 MurR/RpiR family transcriptional regulator [Listeria monocytogenes]EAF6800984.1 MurR/RpiR family transcriptional regulator [Listeria monocytogenes]EAG3675995.1 MurR/RpiR family transcriptional regulator [Listeria monocytogenes]